MGIEVKRIVGEENMTADRKEKAIITLRQLPISGIQKRYLYAQWCRLSKCTPTLADLDQVAKREF